MRFATHIGRGCIVKGSTLLDIETASGGALTSDPSVYADLANHPRLAELAAANAGAFVPYDQGELGPPVPRPRNVVAVALNYREHAAEGSYEVPDNAVYFTKSSASVCGPGDAIEIPDGCAAIDYEAEVVAVIGRRARDVAAEHAWSYVAGITAGQDISDRAEQRREPLRQFSFAKSYDTFSPTGPVLATLDEFADLDRVGLAGRLDGVEVQRATTSELIVDIPTLIAQISARITLEPGDLIFTGTPAGVGSRRTPPLFLRPGMTLETEIPEVGVLVNPIGTRPITINGTAVHQGAIP